MEKSICLPAERRVVEEAQAIGDEAARIPRELALLRQMNEIRLDLALRELIRRPPVELGQTDDRGGVRLLCPLGKTPHDQVVVHSISKLAHDALGEAARRAAT